MTIALFHTTLPEPDRKPGGVEVAVHRLASALAARSAHEVTVFSLTDAPADAPYRHVRLFERHPWLRTRRAARLLLLPVLLNRLDLRAFDVVHLHGDDWFYLRRTAPTVRTLHGSALEEARAATSAKRRMAQYAVYPLEHLSTRLATVPLAVGPRTASIYGIGTLADNGVDLSVFYPGRKTPAPSVLFVGTWEGRKRGRFLYEAFVRDVLPRVPNATLTFVADVCPEHPRVVPLRFPDDETLARLYRESWVFAYPSTYEGFGIPYLEALASGTAVVCSPNDGARYVLGDSSPGAIVADDAFADRLTTLLLDADARRQVQTGGLARARTLSWDAVADRHLDAYRRAIDAHRGAVRSGAALSA